MLRRIIIGSFVVSLLSGVVSPAEAQTGRVLGAAMAIAGGAMLVLDPKQPIQPTQPGVVPRDVLISEFAEFITSDVFVDLAVETSSPAYRSSLPSVNNALIRTWAAAIFDGAQLGGAAALAISERDGRTLYAGPFQPFIPYKERSPGLKYGGLALVAGGALLAVLWPDSPADQVAVAATPGGVRASKTFGW